MYDVIVVGLGPAGSTAAYHLAEKGLKVLALDKATFPRNKSCGGCISKKIERILDFDISEVLEDTVYGSILTYRLQRALHIMSDRPLAGNVRRDRFDHFLVEKAKRAGAEVLEGRRVDRVDGGQVDVNGPVTVRCGTGEVFKGRVLVAADGALGKMSRDFFGMNHRNATLSMAADIPYERAEELSGKIFLDFGDYPYGYAWIFPKKRLLSVGVTGDTRKYGGDIKEFFDSFVSNHYILKDLEVEKREGWTMPLFFKGKEETSMVKGRALLIGDAGHLVDPFLGEGIYYAVKSAQIAATVIHDGIVSGGLDLHSYNGLLKKEVYSELAAAAELSSLIYGDLKLWYHIIEKDPQVMHRYYDVLRGNDNYVNFYRWVSQKISARPWKVIQSWIESRVFMR
jgi:geranylgeranyl reductase family protein